MDGLGSITSMYAIGPQDAYFIDETLPTVNKEPTQYTNFSIDTSTYQFGTAPYLGSTQTFAISTKSIPGDLLCNCFLKCTLPGLQTNKTYCDQVGRALIKSVKLSMNDVELEKLTDDWYIIHDQLFLDADEKVCNKYLINNGSDEDMLTTDYLNNMAQIQLYIPLEFFFCRRFSPMRDDKFSKPYMPICAMRNQIMYITIEFSNFNLLTGYSDPTMDLVGPVSIVFEHITLTEPERLTYAIPGSITVNKVYKEPVTSMTDKATATINLTADYNVALTVWFIRYRVYETDPLFFKHRYDYGYITSDNVVYQDTDPFEYMSILVNNHDVTDKFSGGNFFTHLQSYSHGISSPTKKLYMYSFGTRPTEYNRGGAFDFSTVNSKTTLLNIKIKPELTNDLSSNYSIYVYHYGYKTLKYSSGFCSLE
jgi:Major capsid protein N-terminus/Large eukaryotic DNA virus major capsid protein